MNIYYFTIYTFYTPIISYGCQSLNHTLTKRNAHRNVIKLKS